ncbi:GNAT domain [Phaffia rhodozyma]|uniref:GNAT domain n=1 Tax=Phaffia rhodozyma TaxID=264483 RepID=A0A0F7SMK9_PHARH|nr:GNAT domain [Phaffia rhodozyma]
MSSYLNTFVLPSNETREVDPHKDTPKEAYDLNFMFPVKELRTDKVLVCPLIPSLHAQLYFDGTREGDVEATFQSLRWGPFSSVSQVYALLEEYRRDASSVMFAIYDLTRGPEPEFAGVLGFMRADRRTLSLEIGHVVTLSKFRRTHVLSHACGLAIAYCLSAPPEGLGLRRVQWTASPRNVSSQKAAIRMGFKYEGIVRGFYDLPNGKNGNDDQALNSVEKRSRREGLWKMQSLWSEGVERKDRGIASDCWLASITTGDWEYGDTKSVVERQMIRET